MNATNISGGNSCITVTEIDVFKGLSIDKTLSRAAALKRHFETAIVSDTHNLLVVEKDTRHRVVGFGDNGNGLVDLSRNIFAGWPSVEKYALVANGVMSLHTRKSQNPQPGDGSFRFAESRNVVQLANKSTNWYKAVNAWANNFDPPIVFKTEQPTNYPGIINYIFGSEKDITAFCAALDNNEFDFAAVEIEKYEKGIGIEQAHNMNWQAIPKREGYQL